jgi:hypothetical protein
MKTCLVLLLAAVVTRAMCCDVWEGGRRSLKDSGTRAGTVRNVALNWGKRDRLLYLSDAIYNRTSRVEEEDLEFGAKGLFSLMYCMSFKMFLLKKRYKSRQNVTI